MIDGSVYERSLTTQIGILVIGNEILDGLVLDTNSQWLIKQLKTLKLHVSERITVRDEVVAISKAIRQMISSGDSLIFTTGGLGPTHDDKTLSGIAMAFELTLELNEEALKIVTRQYAEMHQRGVIETGAITESRRKMAILPKGARPLDNRVGGAPGVVLDVNEAQVICLPGVPGELMWIFDNQLLSLLRGRMEGSFAEDIIYLPLRDESTLAPIIDEVMNDVPGVYIKSMVKPYGESGIRLWISASGESQDEVEAKVSRVANLLVKKCEERLPKG